MTTTSWHDAINKPQPKPTKLAADAGHSNDSIGWVGKGARRAVEMVSPEELEVIRANGLKRQEAAREQMRLADLRAKFAVYGASPANIDAALRALKA